MDTRVKNFVLAAAYSALLLAALSGCSGSGTGDAPKMREVRVRGPNGNLTVRYPVGPAPKALSVKRLRKGNGRVVARPGDEVIAHYVGLYYDDGKPFYDTWERGSPTRFHLHSLRTGWEKGVNGMRVGERRELLVPSRLAYETGAIVYVVEVLKARPWGS